MMKPFRTFARPSMIVVAILSLLVVGVALASHPIRTLAGAARFTDASDSKKSISTFGVDLTCNGGPAVMLANKGAGPLGDAKVTGYSVDDLPKDALGRVRSDAAAAWVGVVRPYPGGVTFTIDSTQWNRVLVATMTRLAAVGCQIGMHAPDSNAFSFTTGGEQYRAVFNTSADGVLVYLGH